MLCVCLGGREGHQQEPDACLAQLVRHRREISRSLTRRIGEVTTVRHDQDELEEALVSREILQIDCNGIPKAGTVATQIAQIVKVAPDFRRLELGDGLPLPSVQGRVGARPGWQPLEEALHALQDRIGDARRCLLDPKIHQTNGQRRLPSRVGFRRTLRQIEE